MRRTTRAVRAVATSAVMLLAIGGSRAPAAEPSARALLDEANRLDDTTRAWRDRSQRLSLVIEDGRGNERRRELVMKTRRGQGGEDKTLTVFLEPAEVRGTSFLQFAHRDRDAEQWLFLPELERVRQITARSKNQSFMGTDFSYRDLELLSDVLEWTEEEASSRLLRTERVGDTDLSWIELRPTKKDVGYQRIVVGLSTPDLVIRRMEFYDEESEPKKTLALDRFEQIGAVPTPRTLEMKQPATGSHTRVEVSEVRYDEGLPDDLFTQRALERGAANAE